MPNFAKTEAGRSATLGMQASKRLSEPDDIARDARFGVGIKNIYRRPQYPLCCNVFIKQARQPGRAFF
jgi:hypothetical protein